MDGAWTIDEQQVTCVEPSNFLDFNSVFQPKAFSPKFFKVPLFEVVSSSQILVNCISLICSIHGELLLSLVSVSSHSVESFLFPRQSSIFQAKVLYFFFSERYSREIPILHQRIGHVSVVLYWHPDLTLFLYEIERNLPDDSNVVSTFRVTKH